MLFFSFIQAKIQLLFSWYDERATYLLPSIALFLFFFFIKDIPYVNLQANFFATMMLLVPFLLFFIKKRWNSSTIGKSFLGILGVSIIFHSITLEFHAEVLGTVFYSLLICVTLKYLYDEIRSK